MYALGTEEWHFKKKIILLFGLSFQPMFWGIFAFDPLRILISNIYVINLDSLFTLGISSKMGKRLWEMLKNKTTDPKC